MNICKSGSKRSRCKVYIKIWCFGTRQKSLSFLSKWLLFITATTGKKIVWACAKTARIFWADVRTSTCFVYKKTNNMALSITQKPNIYTLFVLQISSIIFHQYYVSDLEYLQFSHLSALSHCRLQHVARRRKKWTLNNSISFNKITLIKINKLTTLTLSFHFQQEQVPGFVHVFKWTIPNFQNEIRDERDQSNTISLRSPPIRIDNRVFSCIYVVERNDNSSRDGRSHGIYLEICEGSIPVFVSGWYVPVLHCLLIALHWFLSHSRYIKSQTCPNR